MNKINKNMHMNEYLDLNADLSTRPGETDVRCQ